MDNMWNLGFDCATKTFAFSLSYISVENLINIISDDIKTKTNDNDKGKKILENIRLVDCDTIDLFPGIANSQISTIERIRAVKKYVIERIVPSVSKYVKTNKLCISVEYQMAPNDKASIIQIALMTIFSSYEIIVIPAAYKNTICFYEGGERYNFTKYASAYDNNKDHTRKNIIYFRDTFAPACLYEKTDAQLGHIADSFMQILGYIIYSKSTSFSDNSTNDKNISNIKAKNAKLKNAQKIQKSRKNRSIGDFKIDPALY